MAKKHKIFLVDDHALLRHGLRAVINITPDMEVCGEADSAPTALTGIQQSKPDAVVTDLSLKESNGLELIKNLAAILPKLPVLVLSMHEEALYAEQALRAGAKAYVMKEADCDGVIKGLRQILAGKLYLSEGFTAHLLQNQLSPKSLKTEDPLERLTEREGEVLNLLGQWKSTQEIAQELSLSAKTVQYYKDQIRQKLNLETGADLLEWSVNWHKSRAKTR